MEPFAVLNGLSGMKRDLFLSLCRVIERRIGMNWKMKDNSIRALVGMCQLHAGWKDHLYFFEGRMQFTYIPFSFRPNPDGQYLFTLTPRGIHCKFPMDFLCSAFHTVFLWTPVTEGVFRWSIRIHYPWSSSALFIGTAPPMLLNQRNAHVLGVPGDHSLGLGLSSCGMDLRGVEADDIQCGDGWCEPNTTVPVRDVEVADNSLVAVELDADAHTVSFLVNGKKVPHVVTNVFSPLNCGVTGYQQASFTSISFRRLPFATPSPLHCQYYKPTRW